MSTHKDITMKAFNDLVSKHNFEFTTVLDVGARDTKQSRDWPNKEWTGTDMNECTGLIQCKMEDMSIIPDNSFDVVFVCHSLEHCERPVDALREFKRIVKDTGIIFISTPLHCEKQVIGADHDHIMVFTDLQLQRLIRYVDLELIKQWEEMNDYTREISSLITVARKKK